VAKGGGWNRISAQLLQYCVLQEGWARSSEVDDVEGGVSRKERE
jgi:hypothetical protein